MSIVIDESNRRSRRAPDKPERGLPARPTEIVPAPDHETPALPCSEPRRAADRIAALLAEHQVEHVFCLPGGPMAPLEDALLDVPAIRSIVVRHENSAMFAAAGHARTTGKLGVVIVTSGPGILNGMAGLASACCDGIPLLVLVGSVPSSSR